MRNEKLLYAVLAALFAGYVIVEQYAPEPINWTPTFSDMDKNPYGGYVLFDRLDDFFHGEKEVSFQTLYQLRHSPDHVLILSTQFNPSEEDMEAIDDMLRDGRDVFIGAEKFAENFLDSLELSQEMRFEFDDVIKPDSVAIDFNGLSVYYPSSIVRNQFVIPKSSTWDIHAKAGLPVLISKKMHDDGQGGRLILSSTPLAFTNYGILHSENYRFAEHAIRMISDGSILYNRFYHSGNAEPQTPFRYLLSQAPLRWALYLTLFAVGVLLVVGSRRKQRAIPLPDPMGNTTIQFIKTIGGLYYREANHKNAAEKIIRFFLKSLSERYYVSAFFTESSYRMLAAKTGLKVETVAETFDLIQVIRSSKSIPEGTLKELEQKITLFNLK